MKTKILLSLASLLILFSCAPFSRNALRQVDVTLPFHDIQEDIQKAPGTYVNRTVLWGGGSILETVVKNNGTYLKVMDKDLDSSKRPKEEVISRGRFIVFHPGLLDPAVYKPGREISVIGTIAGTEVQPIGGLQYTYPVIASRNLHLWEPRAKYRRPANWDYPMVPFPYSSYPYYPPYISGGPPFYQ